ncbi:hypothetical protein NPIL_695081, partial [Nephila pilipes]
MGKKDVSVTVKFIGVERLIKKIHVTSPRPAKHKMLQSEGPLRFAAGNLPGLIPLMYSKKNVSRKCLSP